MDESIFEPFEGGGYHGEVARAHEPSDVVEEIVRLVTELYSGRSINGFDSSAWVHNNQHIVHRLEDIVDIGLGNGRCAKVNGHLGNGFRESAELVAPLQAQACVEVAPPDCLRGLDQARNRPAEAGGQDDGE